VTLILGSDVNQAEWDVREIRLISGILTLSHKELSSSTRVRCVNAYESQSILRLTFASGVIAAKKSDVCIPESSS